MTTVIHRTVENMGSLYTIKKSNVSVHILLNNLDRIGGRFFKTLKSEIFGSMMMKWIGLFLYTSTCPSYDKKLRSIGMNTTRILFDTITSPVSLRDPLRTIFFLKMMCQI